MINNLNFKNVAENALGYSLFDARLKSIDILPPSDVVKINWGSVSFRIDRNVYDSFEEPFLEKTSLSSISNRTTLINIPVEGIQSGKNISAIKYGRSGAHLDWIGSR